MRICVKEGCGRKHHGKGYCVAHYQKLAPSLKKCLKEGCERRVTIRGLCKNHYLRTRETAIEAIKDYKRRNPEVTKIWYRKWRQNNKERRSALTKAWKNRVKQATPKWLSKEQRKQITNFYHNRPNTMTVDHIIPLQGTNVCGLHVPWNLQYLTGSDNSKKSNKL